MMIITLLYIVLPFLVSVAPQLILGDWLDLGLRYESSHADQVRCAKEFWLINFSKDAPECSPNHAGGGHPNLLLMDGAYCRNDNTGWCSAFSGRFEYEFNVFTGKFLSPRRKDADRPDMQTNGFHTRLPIAYNPDGKIVYADRVLNWAENFVEQEPTSEYNLFDFTSIKWCQLAAANDNWPYKSAFRTGEYIVYFFNRQSCIHRGETKQHLNTRMFDKSKRLIPTDFAMNPTIFPMQDNISNATMLVSHHREFWYENKFSIDVVEQNKTSWFFLKRDNPCDKCRINNTFRHILPHKSYERVSSVCISDHGFYKTAENNLSLPSYCGADKTEVADMPKSDEVPLTLDLNSIEARKDPFYKAANFSAEDWQNQAIIAQTTIPNNETGEHRVLILAVDLTNKGTNTEPDQSYPVPYSQEYYMKLEGNQSWALERMGERRVDKHLNHVDDMAYLHKCDTVLVIFGPVYSEYKAQDFNFQAKARIGAITKLGMWEMTSAFFAVPDENTFWAYHRTNFVARYEYQCQAPALVTAKRETSYRRFGMKMPKTYINTVSLSTDQLVEYSEEYLFHFLKIYNGSIGIDDGLNAPDPAKYKPIRQNPTTPSPVSQKTGETGWLIYIVIAATLLMISIGAICFFTTRGWRTKGRRDLYNITEPTNDLVKIGPPVLKARKSELTESAPKPRRGRINSQVSLEV